MSVIVHSQEVECFLETLFPKKLDDGHFLIWTAQDRRSRWFKSATEAAIYVVGIPKQMDTYVGVGLAPQDMGPYNRCRSDQTIGLVGISADIDKSHKEDGAISADPDALHLARSLGLSPTLVIHSGHGRHAWWLFREPWLFSCLEERSACGNLIRVWQKALRQRAQGSGWTIDTTHDLARLMRVPGTWNMKGEPVMARIVEQRTDRYIPHDFAERLRVLSKEGRCVS